MLKALPDFRSTPKCPPSLLSYRTPWCWLSTPRRAPVDRRESRSLSQSSPAGKDASAMTPPQTPSASFLAACCWLHTPVFALKTCRPAYASTPCVAYAGLPKPSARSRVEEDSAESGGIDSGSASKPSPQPMDTATHATSGFGRYQRRSSSSSGIWTPNPSSSANRRLCMALRGAYMRREAMSPANTEKHARNR